MSLLRITKTYFSFKTAVCVTQLCNASLNKHELGTILGN